MKPYMHLRASYSARLFDSTTGAAKCTKTSKPLAALTLALLVLSSGQMLFAQQYPEIGPSYSAQYPQSQPQNYGAPEPVDVQPQSYGGQPQTYPQQSYQDYGQPYPQQNQAQPLNADQLEQLVAPIALYPDNLVAIVLAASTYPAQVVQADRWRQVLGNASPDQIAGGADVQSWDPSVKALTAFPQVLAQMDHRVRQRLFQPAAGRHAGCASHASARPGRRKSAEHSAANGWLLWEQHRALPGESASRRCANL